LKRALALLLVALPLAASTVKVRQRAGAGQAVVEMALERYVAAVLAGESSVFTSPEALKAMAVAARTWAVRLRGRHAAEGFDFCDSTHCQHIDVAALEARFEEAAADTAGELLWFDGKPAFTPYTADCGGRGEDVDSVWPGQRAPYLQSRDDPYCRRAGAGAWQWNVSIAEIAAALRLSSLRAPAAPQTIEILDRTPSGRARTLLLAGGGESLRLSASSFRFAMGRNIGWNTVRSERFEVRAGGGRLVFEGSGAGHGIGLCQRGAGEMGKAGSSYREILAQYYPGTLLGLTARGIAWQRLGGESIALLTTRPDVDRVALSAAERAARLLAARTALPLPRGIEIRVYPDVETFRNATAEPGWVAARAGGRRIHLQPVPVLQSRGALDSTLMHELLHVLLEAQAAPGLPVWFREGLADYLERPVRPTAAAGAVSDQALRQRTDEAAARRAYSDAGAAVIRLVQRYGETTVLEWLKRGLPPEVAKANASQPATKKQ
jgi:stage II sporulation protein D